MPNIKVIENTDVISCFGSTILENITLKNIANGEEKIEAAKALMIYISTKPCTGRLNDFILKADKGFILTGTDLMKEKLFDTFWK